MNGSYFKRKFIYLLKRILICIGFQIFFLFSVNEISCEEVKIKVCNLINYNRPLNELIDTHNMENISLVISKRHHIAYFVQGNRILKSYPVAMSRNYINDKEREGDGGVPEGVYYITAKASGRIFFMFSPLNYPNIKDAKRALRNGIINRREYDMIVRANRRKASFIPETRAGSAIGIHGSTCKNIDCLAVGRLENDTFYIIDWTLGCIAFNNRDIAEFLPYIRVWRTPIYIVKEVELEKIENIENYLREVSRKENEGSE